MDETRIRNIAACESAIGTAERDIELALSARAADFPISLSPMIETS
jgi:hypothetical protein